MRFRLLARRITLAPALALALALAVGACSSSSTSASTSSSAPASSSASSPAASSAAPSSPGTGSTSAAVAQIKANWEKFFNASTPVAEKVKLLQNGTALESAINAFASFPLASGIGAKVTAVVVNSATKATVSYDLVSGSQTVLGNQTGVAVKQGGVWKVGDASLCALFKLVPGGTVPAACKSAG
jgi:hypothetical protein